MLKATLNSKYRKPSGQLVYTYTVTGTAKELAAYKAAQADAVGKAVEDLTLSANGQPLFWFVPNAIQGRVARKTFNLTITVNNRIVIDDTMEGVERDIKIDEMSMAHEARIIAEAKLGLIQLGKPGGAPTAAPAPAAEKPAEQLEQPEADEIEKAARQLQNAGADGLDDKPEE